MEIKYGRKRSGIVKEINAKVSNWISSIDDAEVASIAQSSVIVTGGCIASMLMGEPVNDFDVYFRDQNSSKAMAEYYLKKAIATGMCPKSSEVVIREIENIKGIPEERVSVYIPSEGTTKPVEGDELPYRVSFITENAITLTDKVQLITRFYGEPDAIHDNFDFAHACCYYDFNAKKLHLPPLALECMLSRTLRYEGSLYPIASIFRMKKFLERGWRINASEQLKIMWQISEIDLTNIQTMRDQLTGVDFAYMQALIGALENVDNENISSEYVSTVIDRIFDGAEDSESMESELS